MLGRFVDRNGTRHVEGAGMSDGAELGGSDDNDIE
jgi:hypothetical protein